MGKNDFSSSSSETFLAKKKSLAEKGFCDSLTYDIAHFLYPETYIEERSKLLAKGVFSSAQEVNDLLSVRTIVAQAVFNFASATSSDDGSIREMKSGWIKAGFNPGRIDEVVKQAKAARKFSANEGI